MPDIPPTDIPLTGIPTPQNAASPADGTRDPHKPETFEAELERAERRLRYGREHPIFGVHPDGVGPTLGQDLGQPNPGHAISDENGDWNEERYDPPT